MHGSSSSNPGAPTRKKEGNSTNQVAVPTAESVVRNPSRGPVKSLLRDWVALQCQMISGVEAGLLIVGTSQYSPDIQSATWPTDLPPGRRLTATVQTVLERGQPSVQQPSAGADPATGTTHIAVPLLCKGRVSGAMGVSLRGLAPGDAKSISQRLSHCLLVLAGLLDVMNDRARIATLMTRATSLLDHEELAPAAHALTLDLAHAFQCERVSIGLVRGGRLRISTLSTSVRFSRESREVRSIAECMEEALDQDALLHVTAESDEGLHGIAAHETWLRESEAGAVCTVPLAARAKPVGALHLEWAEAHILGAERGEQIREVALIVGPILELMVKGERSLREQARARWLHFAEDHFGGTRLASVALAVAAMAIVILWVAPGPYRVSARASLEGRVQRALVASVPGYVSEANARAGDLVGKGFVLARLDDRDLQLEKRKWLSQRAQLEREFREALANQDRTQVSILRAQIDQATAELLLAEESLGRTEVVAPFDGVVLEGDLDRSLGSPVERGDVLFELAPLDGYRVIVEVDGRDIADVRSGQKGRLTLAALPDRPMALLVERTTPVSTTRDGRNYFRVEATLEEPGADLRPGMEGVAKIEAGRRRLFWILTHELFDWLRLRLWSFLP
jgi:RND family efflux transporter MFP subunit